MKDTPLFTVLIAAGALCCLTSLLAPLLLGAISFAAITAWVHLADVALFAGIAVSSAVALCLRHRSQSRRTKSDGRKSHEGA